VFTRWRFGHVGWGGLLRRRAHCDGAIVEPAQYPVVTGWSATPYVESTPFGIRSDPFGERLLQTSYRRA